MNNQGFADMTNSFFKYLQYEKRYSSHTLVSYKNDLDQLQRFLAARYPETLVEEVNHAILRDWIVTLSEEGLGENSINRKLVTLRSFFKFLLKIGVIEKSPVAKITNLKSKRGLPQFVREEEMHHIFEHDLFEDTFEGLRDRLVMEILYGTGIRLSELVDLRAVNFDIIGSSIKVLGKRNKERVIPIPATMISIINKYIILKNQQFSGNANEHLIVTNRGEKCYPMMINRIVKKYLAGVSIDKKSTHILRHTYATHLLERGADLNAVKDLLGHQSLAATQVYTHNSLGKLKKVFDQAHPKA
jgi:integrase/recombinase XerC